MNCLTLSACLVALVISPWPSDTPPNKATETEIAKLIESLNDSDPEVREAAVKSLNRIGIPAKAQLQAVVAGKNRHLAKRVELVLLHIMRQERIVAQDDARARFKELVGDEEQARLLHEKLYAAESAMLAAHSVNSPDAVKRFQDCCTRQAEIIGKKSPSLTSLMAIFWVLSELESTPQAYTDAILRLCSTTSSNSQGAFTLLGYVRELPESSLEKKVMVQLIKVWLERVDGTGNAAADEAVTFGKFVVASQMEFPEEQLLLADRYLRQRRDSIKTLDSTSSLFELTSPVLVVLKHGNRSHLELLEPFLTNKSTIYTYEGVGTQIRDIALPIAVQLCGQSLEEYGFKDIDPGKGYEGFASAREAGYIFPSSEARDAAFEKWNAWVKENATKGTE